MPVEHDTSHQNGQEDTGGGGSNVSTETPSQQPQQAPEPIATTIVNGTHPKVPTTTADEQGRQESPKDPKKVSLVREPTLLVFQHDRKVVWLRASKSEETRKIPRCWSLQLTARRKTPSLGCEVAGEVFVRKSRGAS